LAINNKQVLFLPIPKPTCFNIFKLSFLKNILWSKRPLERGIIRERSFLSFFLTKNFSRRVFQKGAWPNFKGVRKFSPIFRISKIADRCQLAYHTGYLPTKFQPDRLTFKKVIIHFMLAYILLSTSVCSNKRTVWRRRLNLE
jgi:hypothetical protein